MDIFSSKKRSKIMSLIRSSNNKSTELKLIKMFKIYSLTGWRRKYKLVGHPDFVFPHKKIIVFADGCFWHGHKCLKSKPKTNKKFWENKIIKNKKRDRKVSKILKEAGWKVIRIWECEINLKKISRKFNLLKKHIKTTSAL